MGTTNLAFNCQITNRMHDRANVQTKSNMEGQIVNFEI